MLAISLTVHAVMLSSGAELGVHQDAVHSGLDVQYKGCWMVWLSCQLTSCAPRLHEPSVFFCTVQSVVTCSGVSCFARYA